MAFVDSRANPRLTIRDDVTLNIAGTPGNHSCTLENVSKGGIKFFSGSELAMGSRVKLTIPSPEEAPDIILHATIVRLEAGDHGHPYGYACTINKTENEQ